MDHPTRVSSRRYGWIVLLVSAAAMVGSLPGRTQGLGLVTEPLLADLGIDRVSYATLNLWATLIGSAGALGIGYAVDRAGSRVVLSAVLVVLGGVVALMSRASSYGEMAVWITLTRFFGQSALSVVSLAIVAASMRRSVGPHATSGSRCGRARAYSHRALAGSTPWRSAFASITSESHEESSGSRASK